MKLRFAAWALFVLLAGGEAQAGPYPTIWNDVGVCDPNNPTHCIAPDASGNVPVTGTFTANLGGFTPSAAGARMTPLSVTTSDSSGSLPTGAVVVVSNVGTNPMYCNVNGVAATTSDQLITSSGGWFAFTIPNAITTLHCIATGGSTTANGVGGSGLPTGTGGGSGGGGSSSFSVSHASTTALANNLSVKASAGSLLGFNCAGIAGAAAGYCVAYNGAATPATGALTGANVLDFCYFDTTARGCSLSRIPAAVSYGTGIQILITSATSPYTYTTGTLTGAISADYQ